MCCNGAWSIAHTADTPESLLAICQLISATKMLVAKCGCFINLHVSKSGTCVVTWRLLKHNQRFTGTISKWWKCKIYQQFGHGWRNWNVDAQASAEYFFVMINAEQILWWATLNIFCDDKRWVIFVMMRIENVCKMYVYKVSCRMFEHLGSPLGNENPCALLRIMVWSAKPLI